MAPHSTGHLDRGDEGEGGHEHGVARADALGHQRQQQRIGAVRASDAVPRAAEGRKLPLELGDLGPQNELAVVQHGGDRPLDAVAKPFALRGEVDKGRNGLRAVFAHAISTEAPWHILQRKAAKSA